VTTILELQTSPATDDPQQTVSARIDPANGGRLASLNIDGHELLVRNNESANPMAWGSYPMVPFAGRVKRGVLCFTDSSIQLPINHEPHAIHGYGYTNEWDVLTDPTHTESVDIESVDIGSVEGQFAEARLGWTLAEPWPWRGYCTQHFLLQPHRLVMTMTVEASELQPICIGWHPWFKRDIGNNHQLELHFDAASMYELDSEAIPTGKLVTPSAGPWDNCFTGLSDGPTLRWGPLAVELTATTDHWVIFTEPTHALCVEPQTGPPNDVNDKPNLVKAGETASLQFELRWSSAH